jgi:dihydrolipoamide dehydrogenase
MLSVPVWTTTWRKFLVYSEKVEVFISEFSKVFQKTLQKQGLKFKLGTKVISAKKNAKGKVDVVVEPAKGGPHETIEVDVVLLSIGRRPFTQGLGLDQAGVKMDTKGRVITDKEFKTNIPSIRAIGDVIAGPMLAHKAEEEGLSNFIFAFVHQCYVVNI